MAEKLRDAPEALLSLRRADLIVTTDARAEQARALATELGRAAIVVQVRPELAGGEWALLLRRPVYAVVGSEQFGEMLRRFFEGVPGIENLRILVLGRDDLEQLPAGA